MSKGLKVSVTLILLTFAVCKKKTASEKASELIEKGKYHQAITEVRKGLLKDSLNTDLYLNLCQAYVGADSFRYAMNVYLKLYELDSLKADNENLKIYLADYVGMQPYKISRMTRTRSNEYGPYPSPSGLYFASDRGGRSDIYLLKDRKLKRIVKGGGWNSNPVPVSGGLCYSSGFDKKEEIYLYEFKGRKKERLTDNDEGDYPSAANKKGDKILFLSHIDGDWDIYLMDLTKRETKAITKNDYLDGDASFIPDEKHIIFVSKIKGAEKIAIADLKGRIKKVLPLSDVRHPSFVDSDRIVYQGKGGRDWDLYLFDTKSSKILTLTKNLRDDYRPRADFADKKIYFVRKIGRQWDVFMIDLKTPIETKELIDRIKELTEKGKKVS